MRKGSFLILTFALLAGPVLRSSAQFDTISIFHGGIHDGQLLLEEYIRPWLDAYGYAMNAGWYNTATTHEIGGVDVMMTANMTMVPQKARTFDLASLPFDTLQVAGSPAIAPTVAGAAEEGPRLVYREMYNGDTITVADFNSPAGSGLAMMYIPFLQVGLGLPSRTDIIGRIMIPVGVPRSSARMSLAGIGVKHDLKQWMPGLEDIPVGVAFFGGYTWFRVYSGFKAEPDDYTYMEDHLPADFTGQEVQSVIQAFMFDLLLSTDLNYINAFASVGYGRSWSKTRVFGNIPVPVFDPLISTEGPVYTDDHVYKVPDTKHTLHSNLRVNAGFRFNVSLFTLHLAYTWSGRSVYSAGLGMSFR